LPKPRAMTMCQHLHDTLLIIIRVVEIESEICFRFSGQIWRLCFNAAVSAGFGKYCYKTPRCPSQFSPLKKNLVFQLTPHQSSILQMPEVAIGTATRIWELNTYWIIYSQCGVWDPLRRCVDVWECIRDRTLHRIVLILLFFMFFA
jgi:hypothetical protein